MLVNIDSQPSLVGRVQLRTSQVVGRRLWVNSPTINQRRLLTSHPGVPLYLVVHKVCLVLFPVMSTRRRSVPLTVRRQVFARMVLDSVVQSDLCRLRLSPKTPPV